MRPLAGSVCQPSSSGDSGGVIFSKVLTMDRSIKKETKSRANINCGRNLATCSAPFVVVPLILANIIV